jgi:hypothetical protein
MLFTIGTILLAYSSSADRHIEFWAAVGVALGLFLFFRGFSMLRCKRIILNTPASKIRSASMGLVEITGTAKGPNTIPAGITGEACYYYRAKAWQMRESGRGRQWMIVADESVYVPFFVEDPTGCMLVNPEGAELDIQRNFKDEIGGSFFGSGNMMPENVAAFLLRNGLPISDTTRLEEYCVKPDFPLFVFGTLGNNPIRGEWGPVVHAAAGLSFTSGLNLLGPNSTAAFQSLGLLMGIKPAASSVQFSFTGATGDRAVSAKPVPRPASVPAPAQWSAVSIDDGSLQALRSSGTARAIAARTPAAHLDPRVLEAAAATGVATAERDVPSPDTGAAFVADASGFDVSCSTAIGKGTGGQPFMISWHSQREVVQSLAWKSALCIWGGPIMTLIAVYVLILDLGWM